MSDEEQSKVDHTALRERMERLRAEADANRATQEQAEHMALVAELAHIAEKHVTTLRVLVCQGEVARIPECTTEVEASCSHREAPSCPRNIVVFDQARETDHLRQRLEEWSKVPRGILGVILGPSQVTPATMAVDGWLATDQRLLLLTGGLGCGKSVAAGYAIKRSPGRWMHASEIAKAARFEADERMRELLAARLLVIDDLGAEFNDASGWGRAALTTLLLQRYEEGLRTLITTNLDQKTWSTYADPRIKDRLKAGTIFEVKGESLRRRA